jgi:hypothetical protein
MERQGIQARAHAWMPKKTEALRFYSPGSHSHSFQR